MKQYKGWSSPILHSPKSFTLRLPSSENFRQGWRGFSSTWMRSCEPPTQWTLDEIMSSTDDRMKDKSASSKDEYVTWHTCTLTFRILLLLLLLLFLFLFLLLFPWLCLHQNTLYQCLHGPFVSFIFANCQPSFGIIGSSSLASVVYLALNNCTIVYNLSASV